jgi:hypothetical protein
MAKSCKRIAVCEERLIYYGNPNWCTWVAGFVDGEGCFRSVIEQNRVRLELVIEQREDDANLIKEIATTLGCGIVYWLNMEYDRQSGSRSSNKYRWRVTKIKDITEKIIPLFDKYPLRSKKANDYKIWRKMAILKEFKVEKSEFGRKYMHQLANLLSFAKLGPEEKNGIDYSILEQELSSILQDIKDMNEQA